MGHWSRMEYALARLPHPGRLSLRQFLMIAYEELVAEARAAQLDFAARVDFSKEGESIDESRTICNRQYLYPDEELVKRIEAKRAMAALQLSGSDMVDFG
jgi:hypothetical protein